MRLKDRVAIVIGAGVGMGKSITQRYASEGPKVAIAEIHPEVGSATAREIHEAGGDAHFAPTDVANGGEVRAMVEAALNEYGRIDILVNNAAILMFGKDTRVHELSAEVWERTLAVNLRGHWLCSKYVIPHMPKQGVDALSTLHLPQD